MNISRRQFVSALGAASISMVGLGLTSHRSQAEDADAKSSLRVIAYNIYAGKGWPSDRPLAKKAVKAGQMPERLALELALYDPHIVNFSESPSEAFMQEVAERLGMHHVRFPSGGNWPGTLLSKYEILESENTPLGYDRPKDLYTRHWGKAIIKLPNGDPLVVHSAHLYPVEDPTIRLKEIPAMLKSMQPDLDAGRSVLLIGDLNHQPDAKEYELWQAAGLVDTFAKRGQGDGLTFLSDKPYKRIDYIMAAGPIAQKITEAKPLFEGAFRLNPEDENAFALSDHLPQYAVFEM